MPFRYPENREDLQGGNRIC